MKNLGYLVISFIFFILAIAAIAFCVYIGNKDTYHFDPASKQTIATDNGFDGTALGMGVVGAAFILSGAFFLYKAFDGGSQRPR